MAFKVVDGQLTNLHHKNWPKRPYTLHPPRGVDVHISRRFRNLPCQTEQMEIRQHIKLHIKESPPPMPAEAEMRAAIETHEKMRCGCFLEKPVPIMPAPPKRKPGKRKKTTRRSGKYVHRGPAIACAR